MKNLAIIKIFVIIFLKNTVAFADCKCVCMNGQPVQVCDGPRDRNKKIYCFNMCY